MSENEILRNQASSSPMSIPPSLSSSQDSLQQQQQLPQPQADAATTIHDSSSSRLSQGIRSLFYTRASTQNRYNNDKDDVNDTIPLPGHYSNDQSTPIKSIKVIDKQSLHYVILSGMAGGVAGSAAKTLVAPLDRIKILFQTSNPEFLKYRGTFHGLVLAGKRIWSSDGIWGLYQGHSITLLRIFPYASIKFVAYEQIRTILIPSDAYETAGRRFLAGSLSGLASVFFTYPLDLVRVRLAFETKNLAHMKSHPQHQQFMQNHRGRIFQTVRIIYNENPPMRSNDPKWLTMMRRVLPYNIQRISNFYRGFAPTIMGMIPYAGVSFYAHDLLHDILRSKPLHEFTVQPATKSSTSTSVKTKSSRESRPPLKAYAQLVAGGISGLCSQTAAYPFEVIRRRMQVGGAVGGGQFLSFKNTARLIYHENGFKGYFVGLSIGYMKVVPMFACSFFVYERMKKFLGI